MQVWVGIDPKPSASASFGWIGVWGKGILFQVGWVNFDGETQPFECVVSKSGHVYSYNRFGPVIPTQGSLPLVINYVGGQWNVWYQVDGHWRFAGRTPLPFVPGQEQFEAATEVYGGNPIPLELVKQSLPLWPATVMEGNQPNP